MIAPSLRRIVAHWRAAAEDPKTLLPAFEKYVLEVLTRVPQEDLEWVKNKSLQRPMTEEDKEINRRIYKIVSDLGLVILSPVKSRLQVAGYTLFRAILQAYSLPRTLGSKIEAANRFFSRTKRPSIPRDINDLVAQYEKTKDQLEIFLNAAKASISQGKNHEEGGTSLKAGPFTLLNTGGFPAEMMQTVAVIVEDAANKLQKKGLAKVCYGDIHVTRTLTNANTLAFYQNATDQMFVRANIKKNPNTLATILHELGHRMHRKFLSAKQREINTIYRTLGAREMLKKNEADPTKIPTVGESIQAKGKTLYVVGISPGYPNPKIHLDPDPEVALEKSKYSTTLAGYQRIQAQNVGDPAPNTAFVSAYAQKGGPDENFAEMFAFYCMDNLPADQVALLEPVLF